MQPHALTFDRLESGTAVLVGADGAEVTLPASLLPQGSVPGDRLTLAIDSAAAATASREALAKSILNEILTKKP